MDDVSVDSQNAVYEVYNLQGVKLLEAESEACLPALPAGVYLFEQNGRCTKRMIK